MRSEEFRTGKPPVFAAGRELEGNTTNHTYSARHVFITTDDVSNPATRVRASRVKIVPGKYIEMWNAVLYVDGVPVFIFRISSATSASARTTSIFSPATAAPMGRIC